MMVSPVGFGAFKIGRNEGIKYAEGYPLPSEAAAVELLRGVLELGINLVDTAPAYGMSEERVGRALAARRSEVIICTKAGETFERGASSYDYSSSAIRRSLQRSLDRLQTDAVDILLLHSDGRDLDILHETDCIEAIHDLRDAGLARAIGFSGKTLEGAHHALGWADVIMVEHHFEDESHADIIAEAGAAGVGVLVKKPLASGRLDPEHAIPFLLENPHVSSVVIGGIHLDHVRRNVAIAEEWERARA